jgi:serine/threonine protein kinase
MSKPTQAVILPDVSALKDADFARVSDIEKSFKFFKKVNDPRFGDISIIQNAQSRQFIAVKEKKITDRKEAGQNILYARKRVNLKHPNVLNLVDYSVTKQSELCSSFYILKFFFEYPKSDLRKEVQERERVGENFSDIELTALLYQQVQASSFMHAKEFFHGDIQPLHIGYDRDNNASKLIDKFEDVSGVPNRVKQIQKNRLISGQPLYQSPDTYSNLKKGNLNFTVDPSKEDAFAMGLTLLETGNCRSVQNIYDAKNGVVSKEALADHLHEFQNRYGGPSSLLPKSVGALVAYNENERWNFRDLESRLPDFDQVKNSLVNANRNVQGEPIIIDRIITEERRAESYPGLFNDNAHFSDVHPTLQADPYTQYVNAHSNEISNSYVPPLSQDTTDRRIVNMAEYQNQGEVSQNGKDYSYINSQTLPTNVTYTTYSQPYNNDNNGYTAYSQPYNNDNNGYTTYAYQQPNGEQVVNGQYVPNRYVQGENVVAQEVVRTELIQHPGANLSGLKLIKTYIDPTNATDRPNY